MIEKLKLIMTKYWKHVSVGSILIAILTLVQTMNTNKTNLEIAKINAERDIKVAMIQASQGSVTDSTVIEGQYLRSNNNQITSMAQ